MNVQFHPEVHPFADGKPISVSDEKCQVVQEESGYNRNAEWKSGQVFYLDSHLFRGKGLMLSRNCPQTFPANQPQYASKQTIIRVVGHVKEDILLTELFFGGFFAKGVKGLPHPWVLDCGVQIAKLKSPHFFLHLRTKQPYIAVPLIGLVDKLSITAFDGQSARYWQEHNLFQPIPENWALQADKLCLDACKITRDASSKAQQEARQQLRTLKLEKWPVFSLRANQLLAWEIADSALFFEDLAIHWKLANLIPVSVYLKKYISELPFSVFLVERNKENKDHCSKCQKKRNSGNSPIPAQWQRQGLCDHCFPPKPATEKTKFIFCVSVDHVSQ